MFFFFFQAEDGIRDRDVTGVQTCALPISCSYRSDLGSRNSRREANCWWHSREGKPRARMLAASSQPGAIRQVVSYLLSLGDRDAERRCPSRKRGRRGRELGQGSSIHGEDAHPIEGGVDHVEVVAIDVQ